MMIDLDGSDLLEPMDTTIQQESESGQQVEACQIAALVVRAVYNGIDPEYRVKYRQTLWQQMEERVATAARITSSLTFFVSKFARLFAVAEIGADNAERQLVESILTGRYGNPERFLCALREHPQLVVMLVRNRKDEEKQEKWEIRNSD